MHNLIAIAVAGRFGGQPLYRAVVGMLRREWIGRVPPKLDEMIGEGLVAMERVAVLRYAQAARMTADRTQCT